MVISFFSFEINGYTTGAHGGANERVRSQNRSFPTEGMAGSEDLDLYSTNHLGIETGIDSFYQAIHSSDRLRKIEADLHETLMSNIGGGGASAASPSLPPTASFNKYSSNPRVMSSAGRGLSTEEILRIAAAYFIQMSVQTGYGPSILSYPFGLSLSSDVTRSVDLATLLLAAAEKVGDQEYGPARSLLGQCYKLSSHTGSTIQRVVYYLTNTLEERIEREYTRLSSKRAREYHISVPAEDVIKTMLTARSIQLVFHEKVPFSQILQFTSIQTMIDSVVSAKRIHMVDLSIRHGVHWIALMQALACRWACPVKYLRISAVGASVEAIAATGKRLITFAESLNLPFHFKAVIVAEMKYLNEEMLEVAEGEVVGVFSSMHMSTGIVSPDSLEHLMDVLQRLKPCVMVVTETEAKLNSPSFINRFTEALFHFGAWFDCLESVMDGSDEDRISIESNIFFQGMKSIIATEGSDRLIRHVGISKWRSFFRQFGVVEVELSEHSPYLAGLLAEQSDHGSSCSIEMNGKSLTVGWKGTPLFFISAWNFKQGEEGDDPSSMKEGE